MDNITMTSSELVQLIRATRGWTQFKLSEVSKIDQSSLSQYETGRKKPRLLAKKKLIDIANEAGLNVKLSDVKD
jgi:transcriptional regulator with XRE-family HTH domain